MSPDLNLYGLFVPELLACAVVAFLARALLRRLLVRAGLNRLFWHPPLADLAAFVIGLGAITFVLHRM